MVIPRNNSCRKAVPALAVDDHGAPLPPSPPLLVAEVVPRPAEEEEALPLLHHRDDNNNDADDDEEEEEEEGGVVTDAEFRDLLVVRYRNARSMARIARRAKRSIEALCDAEDHLYQEMHEEALERFPHHSHGRAHLRLPGEKQEEKDEEEVVGTHHRPPRRVEALLYHNHNAARDALRGMDGMLFRLDDRLDSVVAHDPNDMIFISPGEPQLVFAVYVLKIPEGRFRRFLATFPNWHPDTHSHDDTGALFDEPILPLAPERFTPAGSWVLHPDSCGIDRPAPLAAAASAPLSSSSSSSDADDASSDADNARSPPKKKMKRGARVSSSDSSSDNGSDSRDARSLPTTTEKKKRAARQPKQKRPRHTDHHNNDESSGSDGASDRYNKPLRACRIVSSFEPLSGELHHRSVPCRRRDLALNAAPASSSSDVDSDNH